jgi:hypothetical protein
LEAVKTAFNGLGAKDAERLLWRARTRRDEGLIAVGEQGREVQQVEMN